MQKNITSFFPSAFLPALLTTTLVSATLSGQPAMAFESCKSAPGESFAQAKSRLIDQTLMAGLRFAREHSHPQTGFVEDTVGNYDDLKTGNRIRSSISSTGFMMALVANLFQKKMVSRKEAYEYCARPLAAVVAKKKADRGAARVRQKQGLIDPHTDITYQGWFAHFIDWETGDRWIDERSGVGVEYATTDSTWFLAGGIICAETFPGTSIAAHFDSIFSDVNFHAFMTDGGQKKEKLTLSMAYVPDDHAKDPGHTSQIGYSRAQWEIYQHSWLVYLLGLGAPQKSHRLPVAAWSAWERTGAKLQLPNSELNGEFLYGDRRALFSHYFPDVFMPPSAIKEACHIDYFHNSQLATRFNREMSLRDISSRTFQLGLWGLDAGPNPIIEKLLPGLSLTVGAPESTRYGVNTPYKRNGTACPACAVAAAMFEPDLVLADLQKWCDDKNFGAKIWGKYGPADGMNLDYGWIAPYALSGIVGPMALSVANLDERTSVWSTFMKFKPLRYALEKAASAPKPRRGCYLSEDEIHAN